MKSIDIIAMAFGNLWRRKTRTILTLLGVIIGTTSIVVMVSIGLNMEKQNEQNMERFGGMTTIEVRNNYDPSMYEMKEAGGAKRSKDKPTQLNDEIVAQIAGIENVSAVMKRLRTDIALVSGKYTTGIQLIGVEPSVMEAFGFKVGEGRLLNDEDINGAFFGSEIAYNFRDPKDRSGGHEFYFSGPGSPERPEPKVNVLQDKIIMTSDYSYGQDFPNKPRYRRYNISVVGTTPKDDFNNSYEVYMPIDFVKKLMEEKKKIESSTNGERARRSKELIYDEIKVKVDDVKNVVKVQDRIKELGFEAWSNAQWMEQTKKTTNIIQIVLGGIGAISLLVAAIGITNTMIMSIYERTREIGVMKVIGCLVGNIRKMFLIEAGLIGLLGGIVGILISFGISYLLNKFLAPMMMGGYGGGGGEEITASYIPVWLVFGSMAFSTFIGVVAGFYPAARATKLSALAAIKND